MSWRVVVVSSRAKLDYRLGSLVVRNGEDEKRIHIDDISVLIIESTAVSLTSYLLAELVNHKVKVIFCDNQHNPQSELTAMYGNYVSSGRIKSQIKWDERIKGRVWQEIIKFKIKNQALILKKIGLDDKAIQLEEFSAQVLPGDTTNREGHAAKVYFNVLFDEDFYRHSDDPRNSALNYGYSLILSCFNREISANGYLTQIGIWHDNAENPFNLGSDLMKPFRPLVDLKVRKLKMQQFGSDEKMEMIKLLNDKIGINSSEQFINNAISIYTRSVFSALEENDASKVMNWYEL